ncbi:serine hydrolase [Ruminococcus sp.]|uniref:D-alanyl-D-alanine carboxypeptidase family protein n=1 Tax=Ruminococcus sp. TaxID=41978 RepID=UPI0025D9A9D0|nr:serine hydrolase [Ruminococcus sp.]MBQ8965524.1 D-alanyl-D-alanine carboxypeptidase [Ruminococcus sp.]
MRNSNRKGGAAIVAVLVMIIIVAVGCAVMVVSGRKTISPNTSVTAPIPSDYSLEEQVPEETTPEEEVIEVLPEVKPSQLPAISESYQTINLKDATCNTAVLLDAESNEIIAGLQYDKKIYPASLTKLMTLLVAVEHIDDMQAKYKFTDKDIDPLIDENASRAGFVAGDEVTMEDLLYAAILPSGADGTLGLANAIAGSEKDFVKMMNDKVAELGLTDTNFVNASGLHDKQHYTTAQDVAVITRACMQNETCRKVLCADKWTTKPTKEFEDGIELDSIFHSRFGGYFIDADQNGEEDAKLLGGKTGFTDEAMFTLSTVVDYNGKEYICVTTKSEGDLIATEDSIMIFENYLPGAVGTPVTDDDDSSESESSDDDSSRSSDTVIALTSDDSSSQADNENYEA